VASPVRVAPRRPDSLGALDREARRLLPLFREAKAQEREHAGRVAAARARLAEIPAAIVAAAATPTQVAKLGQERAALTQLLADADLVARGLAEHRRAAGLEWSSAWSAWDRALREEVFGSLPALREKLARAEAAAAEEYARRAGEMPAA
jgi:hypothetical protein